VIDVPKSNGGVVVFNPYSCSLDLTPGDYDAPVFSLGGQDDMRFRPMARRFATPRTTTRIEAASTNTISWIVPVTGGQLKKHHRRQSASDSTPLYSPDAATSPNRASSVRIESDQFQLMTYERSTGKKKVLPSAKQDWVGTFIWAPDSLRIFSYQPPGGRRRRADECVWSTTVEPIRRPLPEISERRDFNPLE